MLQLGRISSFEPHRHNFVYGSWLYYCTRNAKSWRAEEGGHQEHPGTGTTLMGEPTKSASIEAIARACGMERIRVCNPYNQAETIAVIKEELEADEPSLIISRAPCPLHVK